MRAVGFDPTASMVTTAAGPGGAIVPVVMHDGRTHRVTVEPSTFGGAAVAPPVAVMRNSYQTDETLARAMQADLNAADVAERAAQEAADETFAHSMGSLSTEPPLYTESDSDSGSSRQPAANLDLAPSSPGARTCPAVATTNRFACLVSPGRSRGRLSYAVKQGSGIKEEASRSRAEVDCLS